MQDIPDLLATLASPGQPDTTFQAIDQAFQRLVGHELFTLLLVDGAEVARIYSNRPKEYPVAGRKPMGPTEWGTLVLRNKKTFLGRDKAAIRWAFFDHALIEGMGLGSCIGAPVVYDGACIGTINLLHAEHHYREEHVAPVEALAPLLVPAFLQARAASK
jgi:GAF domain-containing protein